MKKLKQILFIIVISSLALAITACVEPSNSSGSTGTGESSSIAQPDTVAPSITIDGGDSVTVGRGIPFTLPEVTAYDEVDGDVEVTVTYPEGDLVQNGVFCTMDEGVYQVSYSATDAAGNTATATLEISVVEKPYIPTFEELAEGVTFDWSLKFSDMTSSKREKVSDITNASAKAAILGAPEGFSDTVMHLTGSSVHDITSISSAKGNLKGGYVYTFEIWYYGVTTGADYFIAYNGSGNRTFLGDPFQNGLKKATLEYEARSDETGLTFFSTSTIDIYLGNMTVTCEKAPEERSDFYSATHEQMLDQGGYTYDWSENNIAKFDNNAKYMDISAIEDATVKSSIEKTGAFKNGCVLRFAGQGSSYISFLSNNLTSGNEYTISFDAYVKTPGSICLLLMNSSNQQASRADFRTSANADGTTHYTATFTAKDAFAHVSIYIITKCEMYFSCLNISEKIVNDESIVERSDYYQLTYEDVSKEGGYTYDFTEGNALEIGNNADYRILSAMPDNIRLPLEVTGAFDSGYALRLAGSGSSYIVPLNRASGVIKTGYNYTVSFNAYQSVAGSLCMLLMNSGRAQAGRTEFTVVPNGDGTHNYSTTFSGESDYHYANIYIVNTCELFISDMTISIFDPSTQRTDYYAVTYADMVKEGGYTYDWSENNIVSIESNARYVKMSSLKDNVKTALEATGIFKNEYVLRFAGTGSSYISCLRGNLVVGCTYEISFNAYVGTEGAVYLLIMGGQQLEQGAFTVVANGDGTYNYKTTFTAQKGYLSANLYIATACDLYLADFTIAITKQAQREVNNATEESFIASNAEAQLSSNGYAGSNAIALTPSSDQAGAWLTVPALNSFEVGAMAHVSFRFMPKATGTYAKAKIYDGRGWLVDYAYPSGGWSSVSFDSPVVEKDGIKYVYVGFNNANGEVLHVSEVTVDNDVLPEKILGGVKLIQMENANTQMNGYVLLTEGKVVVIDGGDTADASALYDVIAENGGTVHAWFISHHHIDHVNAVIEIINNYDIKIENLYYDFSASEEILDAYGDKDRYTIAAIASAVKNNPSKVANVKTIKQKDTFTIGALTVKVLNNAYFGAGGNMVNDSSVVFKVETPGEDILFFGDLGAYGDTLLNDAYFASEIKTCTIVQASHHGQGGVSDAVYKAIDEIKICLYPAPAWLYDNDGGKGVNTATYGTLLTRALMRELGVKYSYSAVGRVTIE